MSRKPFLKWAGGKRWLLERAEFRIPEYEGTYLEPFLGGGAVFFSHLPKKATISDLNPRLIETYVAIRDNWQSVSDKLMFHSKKHSKEYYYKQRKYYDMTSDGRAAQFLYLNRSCWNGLYRENLQGDFNVPIGTKTQIVFPDDNFQSVSDALKDCKIICSDFETVVNSAVGGDFLFVDPPYTVAHNYNGFVKYNERIFSWQDQIRLSKAIRLATERGCLVMMTNADHSSVRDLYSDFMHIDALDRYSVISGASGGRRSTKELFLTSAKGG